ncbi:hypothetical protein MTY_1583 [Moorella thermoacetica Y72]|uniref:Uncharacterized protein n=1 Tax=Moorella thermoacetica Y72 TaxID=1325331 RepID=A0A0S6UDA5_NEOTH|nr:hypothetical protein MTY_1583 [Moorella thermoacetica Y72]
MTVFFMIIPRSRRHYILTGPMVTVTIARAGISHPRR